MAKTGDHWRQDCESCVAFVIMSSSTARRGCFGSEQRKAKSEGVKPAQASQIFGWEKDGGDSEEKRERRRCRVDDDRKRKSVNTSKKDERD